MTHFATVPYLLAIAEQLPGDPQVDDLGPLFAACAAHEAAAMDTEVYGSARLKAAALLQFLSRNPALEHSNSLFAWTVAKAFLEVNGHQVHAPPKEAAQLVADVVDYRLGVAETAQRLRDWTT
ncbi:fic family toxin-antitoxin system, toxin component [Kitasatospora sp. NPDC050543]|uniref:fic family toxin-antitoxin system, toxin component n=1 Tax=Kitasatospora sp. NPDC050543 TaxID=3364054 RepID=UPI00379F4E6F